MKKKIVIILLLLISAISCKSKKSYVIMNDSLIIHLENYIQTLNERDDFFTKKTSIILRVYPHKKLVNKYWIMFDYNSIVNCDDYIGMVKIKGYYISLFVEKISDEKLEDLHLFKIHNRTHCKMNNQSFGYNELARAFYIYDGKSFEPYTPDSKYWNPPIKK